MWPKCRYKLHVQVMDSTGSTKFMLFDSPAEEIVKVSANDLLSGKFDEVMRWFILSFYLEVILLYIY